MRFTSNRIGSMAAAIALTVGVSSLGGAQQAETGPKIGDMAPDFTLRGVTSDGPMREAIKLSSYRGNTVVLAFFFKARTKG
ncbi:MAG: redoxin domain-containing protein [Gemmatimonadetes bacterium]|nr:redoxin domain-containing protein [Gemmatimonadota bacterium]MCC6770470.1 redoxin domain-containing protein [Gemmatimonadaceae bacterium]